MKSTLMKSTIAVFENKIVTMKKLVLLGAFGLSSMSAFAFNQQAAVSNADMLQFVAQDLSDKVLDDCGCRNTSNILSEIASLTVDVEMEARFGNGPSTTPYLKKVLYKARELRPLLNHIPKKVLKIQIKKELGIAINDLGKAVMGKGWQTFHCASGTVSTTCSGSSDEEVMADMLFDDMISNIGSSPE